MDDEPSPPSTFRYSQSLSLTLSIAITSDQRLKLQHQHFTDDGENDYEYEDDVKHFNKQNALLTSQQQQPHYEQLHDQSLNQPNTVSLSTFDRFRQFREQQQQQQQQHEHEQQLHVTLQPPGKRGRKGSEPRKEMVVR